MDELKVYSQLKAAEEMRKKGMGYAHIRTELEKQGLATDEISYLIRKLDDAELKDLKHKNEKDKLIEHMVYGIGVMLLGGGITYYTFVNDMLEGGMYLAAYGPILGGYWWFRSAWRRYYALKGKE